MTRVRITTPALDDLADLWSFHARESEPRAQAWVDAILKTIALLEVTPLIGHERQESFLKGFRSLTYKRYIIFYRVLGSEVQVLRIIHGHRDIESVFDVS